MEMPVWRAPFPSLLRQLADSAPCLPVGRLKERLSSEILSGFVIQKQLSELEIYNKISLIFSVTFSASPSSYFFVDQKLASPSL